MALHGFLGCGEDFQPLVAAYDWPEVFWVCPDLPGHERGQDAGGRVDLAALDHLMDGWLEAPMQYAKGTKMGFMGVKDLQARADVIAYIESLNE